MKKEMTVKEALEIVGNNRAIRELRNMKRALSILRMFNTEEEEKRLAAVNVLLKEKNKKGHR